ncbi:MAG: hypothetical protein WD904_08750 [Dehalococcoidia bacterium]
MLAKRVVEWIVVFTEDALDRLGIGDVSVDLTDREWIMLFVASAFPALLLVSYLVQLGFQIDNSPDIWFVEHRGWSWRIYEFAATVPLYAPYVGVAFLFLHGVGPVGRSFGTWCFVFAVSTALFVILLTAYGGLIELVVDRYRQSITREHDWHPQLAIDAAEDFGLIAAGYAFLAYRGLVPQSVEIQRREL